MVYNAFPLKNRKFNVKPNSNSIYSSAVICFQVTETQTNDFITNEIANNV